MARKKKSSNVTKASAPKPTTQRRQTRGGMSGLDTGEGMIDGASTPGKRRQGSSAISKKLAEDFFRRIREIKSENPEATRVIDKHERIVHRALWNIREAIDSMQGTEQELVRILVINGIYKAADEILLEDSN